MVAPDEFADLEMALATAFDPSPGLKSSWIADATSTGRGTHQGSRDVTNLTDRYFDTFNLRIALGKLRSHNHRYYKIIKAWYGLDLPAEDIAQGLNLSFSQVEADRVLALGLLRGLLDGAEVNEPRSKIREEDPNFAEQSIDIGEFVAILEGPLGGLTGQIVRFDDSSRDRVWLRYFHQGLESISLQNVSMLA